MAIRNIVKDGDEILHKKCRNVEKFDDKLATLLDDMAETMHKADGVGLGGRQVGMIRRVVVIDIGEGVIELVNKKRQKVVYLSPENTVSLSVQCM